MLITAEALAPQLGISVDQIYRLARTKQIPSHRVGRAVRFNLDEVLATTIIPAHVPGASKTFNDLRPRAYGFSQRFNPLTIKQRAARIARIDWRTA